VLHEYNYFDSIAEGKHMEINSTIDRVYSKAIDFDLKARELRRVADLANRVAIGFEEFSDSIAKDAYPYAKNISSLTIVRTKRKFEELPPLLKEVFLSEYILHNVVIPKDKDNPYHYRKLFENIESAAYIFVAGVKEVQDEIKRYEEYKEKEKRERGYDLPAHSYAMSYAMDDDFEDDPPWPDE
jgi:hypothetical protein